MGKIICTVAACPNRLTLVCANERSSTPVWALSDAALQLAFDRGGLDAVTREETALAGVSLRTFNNYFAGKYAALAYRIAERMRRSVAVFRSRPADEPLWTSIIEAVTGTLEEEMVDITGADLIPDRREPRRSAKTHDANRSS